MAQKFVKLKAPKANKLLKTNNDDDIENKEEYNPICWRFPDLNVCGCTRPCRISVKNVQIFEIAKGLFVGPVIGAYKHSELKQKNIKKILNVSNEKYAQNKKDFDYLQIRIEDDLSTQILPYFEQSNAFIDEALTKGFGVYVHCRAGISRSPSFICAYLMSKRSLSFKEADTMIGRVHPFANPNSSFVRQLKKYEKQIILSKSLKKMMQCVSVSFF